mmetsp:Transcript_75985/g.209682  ORF Transcript_75985/g.209682 Transcript_75985/m.209682 type:complete len:229 (+) Transcript_75985:502-1188(+)
MRRPQIILPHRGRVLRVGVVRRRQPWVEVAGMAGEQPAIGYCDRVVAGLEIDVNRRVELAKVWPRGCPHPHDEMLVLEAVARALVAPARRQATLEALGCLVGRRALLLLLLRRQRGAGARSLVRKGGEVKARVALLEIPKLLVAVRLPGDALLAHALHDVAIEVVKPQRIVEHAPRDRAAWVDHGALVVLVWVVDAGQIDIVSARVLKPVARLVRRRVEPRRQLSVRA